MVQVINRVNKMKSLLILFSSIIVTVISVRRLLVADSMAEFIFGGVIATLFGTFSLFLIFKKKLKSISFLNSYRQYVFENKIIFRYVIIIIALVAMELLFFFYTPVSSVINGMRLFLMLFFAVGIILLVSQLIKIKRAKNSFYP